MAEQVSPKQGYAVIETGGKQYLVRPNDKVEVELLKVEEGQSVDISPVLALSDGETLQIGAPDVKGAKVACTVVKHIRGPKVVSFKKKRRQGYERKIGHRQGKTVLLINTI